MKLTNLKANECQLLRPEIDEALKKVADYYGLVHKTGRMTFVRDGSNITMKIEFAVPSAGGDVMTREATTFKSNATLLGFLPTDLFLPFPWRNRQLKIIGYNGRKRTAPLLCQYTDGAKERVYMREAPVRDILKTVRGNGPWDNVRFEPAPVPTRTA